jgi:extradiol dioxygenase family protein
MTLRAFFDIKEPKKIEMRLTAVMQLEDWHKVSAALEASGEEEYWHPAQELVRMIREMTSKAETSFYDTADKPKVQS